jgi:hypothetical protein
MRRSMLPLLLVLPFSLALALPGQQVTMAAFSTTDIRATAIVGGLPPVVQHVPAGLPTPSVDLFAIANGTTGQATAVVLHRVVQTESEATYEVLETTGVSGTGALLASTGPHEVRVHLVATGVFPAVIDVEWQMTSSHPAGALVLCEVDLDNNGQFEFQASSSSAFSQHRVLSGGINTIRVRTQQAVAGAGAQTIQGTLHLRVRRDLGLTLDQLTMPCSAGALRVDTTLLGELRFSLHPIPSLVSGVGVIVLGSEAQPIALPTPAFCLLVPRADVVAVTPSDGILRVALPPGLGSFDAFVQGAVFTSAGLLPTTAFLLHLD